MLRRHLVIFVILFVFCGICSTRAKELTTKVCPLGVVFLEDRIYLQYQNSDGLYISNELVHSAEIKKDDKEISLSELQEIIADNQYAAWIWQKESKIVKLLFSKKCYQIKIQAIDPAQRRLLSVDGRWYDIKDTVAINRLVAGETVNIYLSFDEKLERISQE
ncbi:MAG TPA: hypothetical protein GX522_03035 [Firmicutes bacterium]|jgi:hypothetical protein|nr:hypothetical protein [Bacillota bacterium]